MTPKEPNTKIKANLLCAEPIMLKDKPFKMKKKKKKYIFLFRFGWFC